MSRRSRGFRSFFLLVVALACTAAALAAQAHAIGFDDAPVGAPPAEFMFATQRLAESGVWEVRGTGTERHLVHLADPAAPARGLSIALPKAAGPANVKIFSRIRFVEGEREAGLAWRYRDQSNFYAAAIAIRTGEIFLFRVMGGNRIRLASSTGAALDGNAWHTVGITHIGDTIRAHVNGINVLTARDPNETQSGRAGVWSSGASQAWFDDIRIEEVTEQR
jgi:hypothetical protein